MGDRREPIPLDGFQVPPVGEIDVRCIGYHTLNLLRISNSGAGYL